MARFVVLAAVLLSTSAAFAQNAPTTLYNFRDSFFDAREPYASVTPGSDGNLYGVTRLGGPVLIGTIYRLTPGGVFTVLHTFTGQDGSQPRGALVEDGAGNFYGTTYVGGAFNAGTVFRFSAGGTLTTLHHFTGGATDGGNPDAGLIRARDGNFYGTTSGDNLGRGGSVFRVSPAGVFTNVVNLVGRSHGPLVEDASGNFYGTSLNGAFRVSSTGTLTNFPGNSGGFGALVLGPDGALYGTTLNAIFRLTPAGVVTPLYTFSGGPDGAEPFAGLTLGPDGLLYGTTAFGGSLLRGTVFRISTSGSFQSLHSFGTGTFDGWTARSEMVVFPNGKLYGTASLGGQFGGGTIYTLTPEGHGQPPSITSHPLSTSINSGATTQLSVTAAGSSLTYQWYSGLSGVLSPIAGATASTFTTPALTSTKRYWVRVSNPAGAADSNTAVVTVTFADSALVPGVSPAKAIHISELRSRIDLLRAARGLPAYVWTDATLAPQSTVVKAVHITDLRTALSQAYAAAGLPLPTFTDPSLSAAAIKVIHVDEIRAAVIALE
jgi:uncharacterized repeat protein (TIGR03803 family)